MTRLLQLSLLALSLFSAVASADPAPQTHERLRLKNTFKTPEEVVSYYCGRDASGFVWSGLLESERLAFTLWDQSPQQDSFYIAKKYQVSPAKLVGSNEATVLVTYSLIGIGDAFGSLSPPPQAEMPVEFALRRVDGAWKIYQPDSRTLAPVVLKSKFPYHPNTGK